MMFPTNHQQAALCKPVPLIRQSRALSFAHSTPIPSVLVLSSYSLHSCVFMCLLADAAPVAGNGSWDLEQVGPALVINMDGHGEGWVSFHSGNYYMVVRLAIKRYLTRAVQERQHLERYSPLIIPLTPRDDGTPVLRYLPRGVPCHGAGFAEKHKKTIECTSKYDVSTRRNLQ